MVGSPGNPQSLNRYAYVLNNPLKFTDPTGHMPSMHSTSSIHDGDGGGGLSWDDPNRDNGFPQHYLDEIDAWAAENEAHTAPSPGEGVPAGTPVADAVKGDDTVTAEGKEPDPQNSPTQSEDTPPSPIESDPKITACHIKVTFGYLVGEGTGQFGRFMDVDVSVTSGGIRPFRRKGQGDPGGEWTVEQTVASSWKGVGTRASQSKSLSRHNDDPHEGLYTISGNKAHWVDAPGFHTSSRQTGRVVKYDGSQTFSIRATNGATTCKVSFGVHSTYRNRTPNIVVVP